MLVQAEELAQEALLPLLERERLPDHRPTRMRQVIRKETNQLRRAIGLAERQKLGRERARPVRAAAVAPLCFALGGTDKLFDLERNRSPLRLAARGEIARLQARERGPGKRRPAQQRAVGNPAGAEGSLGHVRA